MAKTTIGLFDDPTQARAVVEDLENSQFDRSKISLIANDSGNMPSGTGTDASTSAAGASADQGAGVIARGMTGLLDDISPLTAPGVGPVVAAGPFAAMLTSDHASCDLVATLTRMGVPEGDAHFYAEGVRRGGTIVAVSDLDDDAAEQAADIMYRHSVVDIGRRGERYQQAGFTGFDRQAQPFTGDQIARERAASAQAQETVSIPVVEEELQVGKRQVQRGGARVYTHVSEQPVSEQVQLREEHVTVDRRPVSRPATEADMEAFREGSIEVPETSEEAVVSKQARVVEEVVVSKEATERAETVQGTVRHTDVDVQPMAGGRTAATAGRDVTSELDEDEEALAEQGRDPSTRPVS